MPKSGQKQNDINKNKEKNPTSSSRQICPQSVVLKHFRNICPIYFSEHHKRKVARIISVLQLGKFGSGGNWAICLGTENKSQCSWDRLNISRIRITCSKPPSQAQDEMTWCPVASDNGMFFLSPGLGCDQSPQRRIKGVGCVRL